MNKTEMQARIRLLKDELETRHKQGTIKLANADGSPIPVEELQKELFSLIYKSSKID